jgi:hypothetical protein
MSLSSSPGCFGVGTAENAWVGCIVLEGRESGCAEAGGAVGAAAGGGTAGALVVAADVGGVGTEAWLPAA